MGSKIWPIHARKAPSRCQRKTKPFFLSRALRRQVFANVATGWSGAKAESPWCGQGGPPKGVHCGHITYLRQVETEMRQANPSIYEPFNQHREKLRQLMTSGPFLASAERLAQLENEESRLLDFAAFFQTHPQKPVLDFWGWDARFNPRRFGPTSTTTVLQETRP